MGTEKHEVVKGEKEMGAEAEALEHGSDRNGLESGSEMVGKPQRKAHN